MNTVIPRPEHPRPDFMRDTFLNLNGIWQFAFDDADEGVAKEWMKPGFSLPMEITVPFAYQTKMSGIGPMDEIHPVIWYSPLVLRSAGDAGQTHPAPLRRCGLCL